MAEFEAPAKDDPDNGEDDGEDDETDTPDGANAAGQPAAGGAPAKRPRVSRRELAIGAVTGAATLIALFAAFLLFRDPLLRVLPAAAGAYRSLGLAPDPLGQGLEIRELTSERTLQGGDDVLVVRGVVANVGDRRADLPDLRVSLYDDGDHELQSVVVPRQKPVLETGESLAFEATIASPNTEARRLRVGFSAL